MTPQAQHRWLDRASGRLAAAVEAGAPLGPLFRREALLVEAQLREDAHRPDLLGLWGESLNYDEFAKQKIVSPTVLEHVGELARLPLEGRVVHAGLAHTYGYLFSRIETPFGLKRDRWVNPDLEVKLGIAEPSIRALPSAGTLLTNLTYLLGRWALDDDAPSQRVLDRYAELVPEALEAVAAAPPARVRVTEALEAPTETGGEPRSVRLVTDLFALPVPSAEATRLLVYSIRDGARLFPELMTAFPVGPAFASTLSTEPSDEVEVRTRYNAFVAGVSGLAHRGRRSRDAAS